MRTLSTIDHPLISVIIPCYNQGHFLADAIESVKTQSYLNKEIIVIDDGSTDNTKEIAAKYADVKYIYQHNAGLSSARNTGIEQSNGVYLVFLDADDWLLPNALEMNFSFFKMNKNIALVSGAYILIYTVENKRWEVKREVKNDHYLQLLQGNYIGMVAGVMFQRWVFNELRFSTDLLACEDYDLYLRIAKKYPVFHHEELISVYRIHKQNTSSNYILMLKTALEVLDRQKCIGLDEIQLACMKKGFENFKKYYSLKIYDSLVYGAKSGMLDNLKNLYALWNYNKPLLFKYTKDKLPFNTSTSSTNLH